MDITMIYLTFLFYKKIPIITEKYYVLTQHVLATLLPHLTT